MRRICISLSKGGVGKSSTAIALAVGLSKRRKRVLLIDTDDQGQDAFLLGVDKNRGLDEVILGSLSARESMKIVSEYLWLLPSGLELSRAKREVGKKEFRSEETLREILYEVESEFDFVIIDTSPSFDSLTINALFYCDEVITPVSLEVLSLNSLKEFSKQLVRIQKHHPKLKHTLVLPTFFDKRVKKSKEILSMLKKHYQEKICDPIGYNVKISECAGFGKSIFDFAPNSSGSKDYENFVTKVLEYDTTRNP